MAEGLNKISGCDNDKRIADVIFVHGLDGDAYSTWQADNKSANYWPKWLGDEFEHIGVWSLGYAVSSSAWKGSSMPLVDRATNILDLLDLDGIGKRPIIFICHSLGGLVVKQMLRHASDFGNAGYKRIVSQTRGIVFLSTPHSGSNIANWMGHVSTLLRATVSVDELQAHHPRLRELNQWFRNYPQLSNIKIFVYYEKKTTHGVLVVDETSADPGIAGVTPTPMDDDHVTICKPKDKSVQVYRRVKRLIEEIAPNPIIQPSKNMDYMERTLNAANDKTIFISYSHDSDGHRNLVAALSARLRSDGLTTVIDQYVEGSPEEGWPRWMQDRVDEASHVLVICTETYYRRFRGHEVSSIGKGVDWEGALITQALYDARNKTNKFVPVLFDSQQQEFIPEPLRSKTHYVLNSEPNYQALYDFLLNQSGVKPSPIGPLIIKPKQTIKPLTFNENTENP